MSFVPGSKAPARLKSPEQCAREILEVALARNLDSFAAVLGMMGVLQESDCWCPWNRKDPSSERYPHDSESDDGRSVAYLQEQNGRAGEELPVGDRDNWWGPMSSRMDLKRSMNEFLARLTPNYHQAENDPALASEFISNVQRPRPDLRGAYAKHWNRAHALINAAGTGTPADGGGTAVGWTGDPVWLEDVLRPVLGNRLKTMGGWQDCGHGDFLDIRGVMMHHTGNSNADAASIRNGRPDLAGPLANLHIASNGDVTIVAVGVCWHAGVGSYPWLPTNNANWHMIGIECAWPDIAPNGSYDPHQLWPNAQILSMRDTAGALLQKLGWGSDRVIGHKDYAGAAQGKWDPGNLSTAWFQGEVGKWLRGEFAAAPTKPPVVPTIPPLPLPIDYERQSWEQIRGRWEMLGWQTPVETLAEIRDHLLGTSDKGKKGVRFD